MESRLLNPILSNLFLTEIRFIYF